MFQILGEKGESDKALAVLKLAAELEPDNKAVMQVLDCLLKKLIKNLVVKLAPLQFCFLQEIGRLKIKWSQEKKSEKLLYKRMFNHINNSDQSSKNRSPFKLSFNSGLIIGGAIIAIGSAMAYRYAT